VFHQDDDLWHLQALEPRAVGMAAQGSIVTENVVNLLLQSDCQNLSIGN
jgi:hypothetical protein